MRDIPTSPRAIAIKRARRIKKIRLVVLLFLLLTAIIFALSFFSSEKHITIDSVVVTGNHIIDSDDIEAKVEQYISGKYIYLFSKANSFIYPHDKIYKNLLLDFPRIKTLSVSRDNLKTLHISITERVGSYLYCGSAIPESKDDIGENCYFINNDGFIFDKAPYFSGNVYFKYYMDIGIGDANPQAKQMLSEEKFHKLANLVDGVTYLGFKPIYILTDNTGTNYLYLDHEVNSTAPYITFKNDDDFDEILENISVAMKKKEFADDINSKYNTLLYIDLRFKDKVLYKFQ